MVLPQSAVAAAVSFLKCHPSLLLTGISLNHCAAIGSRRWFADPAFLPTAPLSGTALKTTPAALKNHSDSTLYSQRVCVRAICNVRDRNVYQSSRAPDRSLLQPLIFLFLPAFCSAHGSFKGTFQQLLKRRAVVIAGTMPEVRDFIFSPKGTHTEARSTKQTQSGSRSLSFRLSKVGRAQK